MEFLHQSQSKKEHLFKNIGIKVEECSLHLKKSQFVCRECKEFCCFSCILVNEPHFGHTVQQFEECIDIINEIKEIPKEKIEKYKKNLETNTKENNLEKSNEKQTPPQDSNILNQNDTEKDHIIDENIIILVKSPTGEMDESEENNLPLRKELKPLNVTKIINEEKDQAKKRPSLLRRFSISLKSPIVLSETEKSPSKTETSFSKLFKRGSISIPSDSNKERLKELYVSDVNSPKLPEKKSQTLFNKLTSLSFMKKEKNESFKPPELKQNSIQVKIPKLFGVDIETVEVDDQNYPKVIKLLIERIKELNGKEIEGIFRISGEQEKIEKLKNDLEDGITDLSNYNDVNVISSTLKLYFRSLPTPLFDYELSTRCLKLNDISDQEKRIEEMKDIIKQLSSIRKTSLYHLLELLNEIEKNSRKNLMDSKNLSVVFALNLIKSKQTTGTMEEFYESQKLSKVFEEYIVNYDKIKDIFV